METMDTIAALATPRGTGALAVIRISGPEAFSIVNRKILEKEKFLKAKRNNIYLYHICDDKGIIDEITAIKYIAPISFTGENMIEIICHGGEVVVRRILETLILGGMRHADRGEFTKRAFLNGKTDLAGAEAINQIINSKTDRQQQNAINNYMGGYKRILFSWKREIEQIVVEIESVIEFGEEDDIVNEKIGETISKKIRTVRESLERELNKRKIIKEKGSEFVAAIVGPPNAGKSTLINTILGFERSIIHHEAGTTRDIVAESINFNGIDVKFIDTAGLCEAEDEIEKMGVERAWNFVGDSDLVILITAADEDIYAEEKGVIKNRKDSGTKIISIINKTDLSDGKNKENFLIKEGVEYIKASIIEKKQRKNLIKFIFSAVNEKTTFFDSGSLVITSRQEQAVEKMINLLKGAERAGEGGEDIAAQYCREVLGLFGEYCGKTANEEIINEIFNEFCIGK